MLVCWGKTFNDGFGGSCRTLFSFTAPSWTQSDLLAVETFVNVSLISGFLLDFKLIFQRTNAAGQSGNSRLCPDLPKVVEELRKVGLEQPLELQAQRHDTLQEHTCNRKKCVHAGRRDERLACGDSYRGRGGDGVQSEEVADVHFPEDAVQFGWLVVQET